MQTQQNLFTGAWMHLFGPASSETECRIVLDVANAVLVAAESKHNGKWTKLSVAELEDLSDSVIRTNTAHQDPDAYDLDEVHELPVWATPGVEFPLSDEAFVALKRDCCPFCGSNQIVGMPVDIQPGIASQQCGCDDCDAEWDTHYVIASYAKR